MAGQVVKTCLECPSCGEFTFGVDPEADYVECGKCGAVIAVGTGLAYFPKPSEKPSSGSQKAGSGDGDDTGADPGAGEAEEPEAERSAVDAYLSGDV